MKAILTIITTVIGKIKSFFVRIFNRLERFVEKIVAGLRH
tara:strand:- start:1317 stop:1436 length:120 start_codon:yes stop_codon:yes gene_type:complete